MKQSRRWNHHEVLENKKLAEENASVYICMKHEETSPVNLQGLVQTAWLLTICFSRNCPTYIYANVFQYVVRSWLSLLLMKEINQSCTVLESKYGPHVIKNTGIQ